MKNLPEHITHDLLAKYFAGESSIDENTQIENWLAEDKENAEELLQYEMIWQDLGQIHDTTAKNSQINTDEAWEKLKLRKTDLQPEVLTNSWGWIKIAASILLVLGMFAVINQLNKKEQILIAETSENIQMVALADGSEITLNNFSVLNYPETFKQEIRQVNLTGEAFFKISENPDKPFIVNIGQASVKVLGTSFNIKSSKNLDTVSVGVSTGKVRFAYQNQEKILTAGEKATLIVNQQSIFQVNDDQSGLDDFWRTRQLRFTGQKLSKVVETINTAYQSNIQLKGKNLLNCRLNVSFENDSLENILEVIALTLQLEVSNDNNQITLIGEGCGSD